ncbi:Flp pilus assembly protein CpaB [Trinickia dinghuensis]|uniref:Flp pilus assembly protein CpaB n=1 Tax=Trinickia dinghuensis TaxID=2291023 RepID=A0A3D8JX78_9BURK|nr:Flp pilus assembly protein CpaB [Trinickia dinghuensis]RDU97480.1 Flp pilus assembly protein CpaB [Trinickia dinghuensis]
MKHLNMTKMAAVALIAAALLLGFYALVLSRRPAPVAPVAKAVVPAASFPVVVATHLLPAGAAIASGDLRVVMLPVRPSGAFSDTSLVARRVPLSDIGANVPVLEAQLSSGFAEQVAPGERAVAIHVDDASAVGNRVRPGNFVDVFFTLKRDAGGIGPNAEITRSQTRLLLSRVRVLAFGGTASGAGNPSQFGVGARTAVLAVPIADVDRLALADSAGHVLLALRNPRDEDVIDPNERTAPQRAVRASVGTTNGVAETASMQAAAGISLRELSGGVEPARAPARVHVERAYAGPSIEVIRGGRAQTLSD